MAGLPDLSAATHCTDAGARAAFSGHLGRLGVGAVSSDVVLPGYGRRDEARTQAVSPPSRKNCLSTTSLSKIWTSPVGAAGDPHTLGHAFVSRYLEAGGTLAELRDILSHADIVTTDRYLHSSASKDAGDGGGVVMQHILGERTYVCVLSDQRPEKVHGALGQAVNGENGHLSPAGMLARRRAS
jgi:hypothetical protein